MYVEGNYVFGRLKQNLQVDQRVVLGRTSSPLLDGKGGTILGQSIDDAYDAYIVLLDEPIEGQKPIVMTEACLCPI